tara:strand:- start:349 stop:1479 length:1131 start_codon:yes stop_codon:yes gene_type:complete
MNTMQHSFPLLIKDAQLARKVLASKSFTIAPVPQYIRDIDSRTEHDFSFLSDFAERILLFMDGKELWETKKLLAQSLNREELNGYTMNFQHHINRLLTPSGLNNKIDLVNDVTNHLYKYVVEDLWGIRVSSLSNLLKMANGVAGLLEPMPRIRKLLEYQNDCEDFYKELIPQVSVLGETSCLASKLQAKFAFLDERNFCFLLMSLVGGMRSAFDALNNSFFAFLQLDVEKRVVLGSQQLFEENVDLFASLFSPSKVVARICSETTKVGGQEFIRGQCVLIDMRTASTTLEDVTNSDPLRSRNFFNKNISNVHFGAGVHRCPGKDVSQFIFPKIFNAATEQLKYSTLNSADVMFEDNEMTKRIISMPIHVMQTIETL